MNVLVIKTTNLEKDFSDIDFLTHGLLSAYQHRRMTQVYNGPKLDERLHWFKLESPELHSVFLWESRGAFPWESLVPLIDKHSSIFWYGNFREEELEQIPKIFTAKTKTQKYQVSYT